MACCLFTAVLSRGEITLDVQPNRTQIYLGETLLLNVTVNGADDSQATPDLSSLPAEVKLLGSQSQSQHMIQIINGHMTRNDSQSRLFAFQVKPRSAGMCATGPITLTLNNRRYEGHGPAIEVVGQEQQDMVFAGVTASREAVLVDEPFTITLSVAIAGLPPPNAQFEPIHPASPPRLECPFLSQADIPGLQAPNLQQLLQGLVANDPRVPAFQINDYQAQSANLFSDPFGDLDPFHPRPIRFQLTRKMITRQQRVYHEYTLPLTYTPRQEGDYTFGPVAFKGMIVTGADATGHALTRNISCVGPAVTVRVVPPPETNRPDCFIGSVGSNLSAHAELDASVCKVGDPLTLTLDITGAVSTGNMRPPVLNLQPELTADFRIYDDNVESSAIPGGKRFRYRVIPLHEGTREFPPIQVAWFDTASRAYRMARTQPIPVQARANTQISSDSTNAATHVTRLAVERTTTTPSAITVVESGARAAPLLPPPRPLLTGLAAGPLSLLLLCAGQWFVRHRDRLSAKHQRHRALSQALDALHRAGREPQPDAAAIGQAIRSFLAARLSVAGSALTSSEAALLLQARGVPAALSSACGALLARLDQALYRPDTAAGETAEVVRAAIALLPQITAMLDHPPKTPEEEA